MKNMVNLEEVLFGVSLSIAGFVFLVEKTTEKKVKKMFESLNNKSPLEQSEAIFKYCSRLSVSDSLLAITNYKRFYAKHKPLIENYC
jgi:hypothetical protein